MINVFKSARSFECPLVWRTEDFLGVSGIAHKFVADYPINEASSFNISVFVRLGSNDYADKSVAFLLVDVVTAKTRACIWGLSCFYPSEPAGRVFEQYI